MIANYSVGGLAGADETKIAVIAGNKLDYINNALKNKDEIANGLKGFNTEGDDHFFSTFDAIDKLYTEYRSQTINITQVIERVKDNTSLYRWVIAILVILIEGGKTNFHVEGGKTNFHDVDVNFTIPPFNKLTFLRPWRKRFDDGDRNHNSTNRDTIKLLSFEFNGKTIDDKCIDNVIGCYSDIDFVIPSKELYLDDGNLPIWKQKFKTLLENRLRLFNNFDNYFSPQEKVLLKLSVSQLPTDNMPHLQIVKDIIDAKIPDALGGLGLGRLPFQILLTINEIPFKLFQVINNFDVENLLNNNIYVILKDNQCHCLYPFTSNFMNILEKGIVNITNLSFEVNINKDNISECEYISSATVSFNCNFSVSIGTINDEGTIINKVDFPINKPFQKTYSYEADNIYYMENFPTFCMFPNIPLELEYVWREYQYFSCNDYPIASTTPTINNNRAKSINFNEPIFSNPFGNFFDGKKSYDVKYRNNSYHIWTKSVNEVTHFIPVHSGFEEYGCILNLKIGNQEYPALLENGNAIAKIDLNFRKLTLNNDMDMYAYIDFGSSSSYMKYKLKGALRFIDEFVVDDSLIREILVRYENQYYQYMLNKPNSTINKGKFLSISALYDDTEGVTNYYPFMESWLPIITDFSDINSNNLSANGIEIQSSNKTNLLTGGNNISPEIIINNMCYMIVISAIVKRANNVYIVPSLPNSSYKMPLYNIWKNAINNINLKLNIPLNIYNALTDDNEQYLYESIAVSNGIVGMGVNILSINIDIGDGTTDMSAVFVDLLGRKTICGYSSLEYAGKNLFKTTMLDIVNKGKFTNVNIVKDFIKGQNNWTGHPLFIAGDVRKLNNYIDNFVDSTVNNRDSWENDLISILNIAKINPNTGLSSINDKVAANFIMRYVILMPVIKDFISTSIKLGNVPDNANININFYGGSSKGLNVINNIDHRNPINTYSNIEDYFTNAFANHVTVTVSTENDKQTLVNGLDSLNFTPINVPNVSIGGGMVDIANPNPMIYRKPFDYIDPKDYAVHASFDECNKFKFTPITPGVALGTTNGNNIPKIKDCTSYYDVDITPYEDFKNYYYKEIYQKFISNGDGIPDVIETLLDNFINDNIVGSVNSEILPGRPNNSFYKATHSYIYPEMIKNTIYMYALSELLTKHHNKLNNDEGNIDGGNAEKYKFG